METLRAEGDAMSQLQLTYHQRRRLRRQLALATDARLYRRTLAVLEFDRGRSAADIAGMLGVTRQSVSNWVAAYADAFDPAALADANRPGRPPLLGQDAESLLGRLLGCSPQDLGYPHTTWTVPLLQEQIRLRTGLRSSDDTVRRKLHQLDCAWKRPRYALDRDPELRGKKEAHPGADPPFAATERRAGRGRDRPVAVPAAAGGLVACGPGRAGGAVRA
jgi:transposase